jgi:1-acyl-sn-glycerol-3-phosphate acyltransferase
MSKAADKMHKFSLLYFLLRSYEKFAFKRFYKHIQVIGRNNIPYGEKFIFAPNHQNALMDALAVLNFNKITTVFVARADIFKNKKQAAILNAFKMLPIYRMRDGAAELSKNEEIFRQTANIINHRMPLCIMPEGNHGDKRRLRSLVKGIFRIAFKIQEEHEDKQGVKIVPVGLDYSNYDKFFQNLLIIYGQPIEVSEYFNVYKENPAKGINDLRERLSIELKKLMIHIENEEYYDMYEELRTIYNKRMRLKVGILGKGHYERFRADKQMIRMLDDKYQSDPDRIKKLSEKVSIYASELKSLNLRNWIFERSGFTSPRLFKKRIGLIISFPFFLYGYINNWLPYTIPVKKIKNIKDVQFHSSFKFVLALILFPVFYALQTILVGIFTGPSWIPWVYLLSIPIAGYFALFWSIWYKRWKAGLKYRRLKKKRDDSILNLERHYKEIMKEMDNMADEYMKQIETKLENKKNER